MYIKIILNSVIKDDWFFKDDPYYSDWRRMDNFSAEDLVDESSSRDIKTIEKKMIVGLSAE